LDSPPYWVPLPAKGNLLSGPLRECPLFFCLRLCPGPSTTHQGPPRKWFFSFLPFTFSGVSWSTRRAFSRWTPAPALPQKKAQNPFSQKTGLFLLMVLPDKPDATCFNMKEGLESPFFFPSKEKPPPLFPKREWYYARDVPL